MTDRAAYYGDRATRIPWIDIVKALAAWMVVTAHLLRQGALTDLLAAISVSMFYVLAGVTLHRHTNLPGYLRRLMRRVMVPYLTVGLISIMIYRILGSYAAARLGAEAVHTTILEDLFHLLYGSSVGGRMKWNESLWFLPCYCLMVLVAQLIERVGQRRWVITAALYIAGGMAGYAMITAGVIGLPWHLETALLVLPLCGCGRWLRYVSDTARIRTEMAALVGVGCVGMGGYLFPFVSARAGGSLSLRAVRIAGAGETYLFLLGTSIGMLALMWACARRFRVPEWVPRVGARSLEIMLWNKFPVLFLQVIVPAVVPGFDAMFIGGTGMGAMLVSAFLALPCMAACLLWTACYTSVIQILYSHGHRGHR